MKLTRRHYLQRSAATLAAAGLATPANAKSTKKQSSNGCFQLTELLNGPQSADVKIAKQVGIQWVISSGGMRGVRKEEYVEAVRRHKESFAAVGMKIAGVEGHPVPFERSARLWP